MKLMVIGVGNCGCQLAGEFAELNRKARKERHVDIITSAYAIHNDQAFLDTMTRSRRERLTPVLIRDSAEGDANSSEAGARLMRRESERVMLAMRLGAFVETDAFLFVAGAGGSLGSGGVPVLVQMLKERRVDKPVYALIILPRDSETDDPNLVRNTAVCLKSVDKLVDAVILVDNGGFGVVGEVLPSDDMGSVNKEIVYPFYDLLCAGEMAGTRHIGGKVLDAGDIVQSLSRWTAIGVGRAEFDSSVFLWRRTQGFEEKISETRKAVEAMNLALMRLSVDCDVADAGKALYLLSVPEKRANVDMISVLGNRLREAATNAEIRDGSFYGAKGFAQVTVAVSELIYVDRIKSYYDRAAKLGQEAEAEKKPE